MQNHVEMMDWQQENGIDDLASAQTPDNHRHQFKASGSSVYIPSFSGLGAPKYALSQATRDTTLASSDIVPDSHASLRNEYSASQSDSDAPSESPTINAWASTSTRTNSYDSQSHWLLNTETLRHDLLDRIRQKLATYHLECNSAQRADAGVAPKAHFKLDSSTYRPFNPSITTFNSHDDHPFAFAGRQRSEGVERTPLLSHQVEAAHQDLLRTIGKCYRCTTGKNECYLSHFGFEGLLSKFPGAVDDVKWVLERHSDPAHEYITRHRIQDLSGRQPQANLPLGFDVEGQWWQSLTQKRDRSEDSIQKSGTKRRRLMSPSSSGGFDDDISLTPRATSLTGDVGHAIYTSNEIASASILPRVPAIDEVKPHPPGYTFHDGTPYFPAKAVIMGRFLDDTLDQNYIYGASSPSGFCNTAAARHYETNAATDRLVAIIDRKPARGGERQLEADANALVTSSYASPNQGFGTSVGDFDNDPRQVPAPSSSARQLPLPITIRALAEPTIPALDLPSVTPRLEIPPTQEAAIVSEVRRRSQRSGLPVNQSHLPLPHSSLTTGIDNGSAVRLHGASGQAFSPTLAIPNDVDASSITGSSSQHSGNQSISTGATSATVGSFQEGNCPTCGKTTAQNTTGTNNPNAGGDQPLQPSQPPQEQTRQLTVRLKISFFKSDPAILVFCLTLFITAWGFQASSTKGYFNDEPQSKQGSFNDPDYQSTFGSFWLHMLALFFALYNIHLTNKSCEYGWGFIIGAFSFVSAIAALGFYFLFENLGGLFMNLATTFEIWIAMILTLRLRGRREKVNDVNIRLQPLNNVAVGP